MTQTITVFNLR